MPVDIFGNSDTTYHRLNPVSSTGGGGGGTSGVSQAYVDTNFIRRDGANGFTGELDMNNNKILGVTSPEPGDADTTGTNKGYVDGEIVSSRDTIYTTTSQTYLSKLTGGSVQGAIQMNSNNITGLPSTPSSSTAAASKAYVDAQTTSTLQNVNNTFLRMDGTNPMSGNPAKR